MVNPYHKIQTVWFRDPATNHKTLLRGHWARPEFELLADCEWEFTEKVDGTNIRVLWDPAAGVETRGKTDAAQLLPEILACGNVLEARMGGLDAMTLYCEGFGPKIQKGGKYRAEPGLALFDVYCGGLWLERGAVEEIGARLGLDVVPVVGRGSLHEMVDMVRGGFHSRWSSDPERAPWAEGVVARPAVELLNRRGDRVITKLKARDFAEASAR